MALARKRLLSTHSRYSARACFRPKREIGDACHSGASPRCATLDCPSAGTYSQVEAGRMADDTRKVGGRYASDCVAGALLARSVVASPARSQSAGDLRFGDRLRTVAETVDEAAAARSAHSMAKCVANKRPDASVRMLSVVDFDGLRSAHRSIWSNELGCYSEFHDGDDCRFATSFDIERGLIAEHLVREADNQVLALAALPLRPGTYKRDWFGGTGRSAVADEMSACLAETTPSWSAQCSPPVLTRQKSNRRSAHLVR